MQAGRQLNYTRYTNHHPLMKGIINKLGRLFSTMLRLPKPTPNQFNSRYAEKFANPDHYQWQGGRLLSATELRTLQQGKAGQPKGSAAGT